MTKDIPDQSHQPSRAHGAAHQALVKRPLFHELRNARILQKVTFLTILKPLRS
jgi:hypothetical protein